MQPQNTQLDTIAISLLLLKPCNSLILGTKSSELLKLIPPYSQVSKITKVQIRQVECLAQGEDDRFWASGSFESSHDFSILCFSSNLEELFRYSGHSDVIIGLAFNSIHLYSASEDRTVRIWSKSHPNSIKLYEHEAPIMTFDADLEDNLLASADNSYNLQVFSILNKKIVFSQCLDEKIWDMKFMKGKKRLLCGDQEGRLICFDLDKKIETFQINAHQSRVKTISVFDDLVVTGSFDCSVSIWEWPNNEKIHHFESHTDWVRSVLIDDWKTFSVADDSLLCVYSIDKRKIPQKNADDIRKSTEMQDDHRIIYEDRSINHFFIVFQEIRRVFFSFMNPGRNFWRFLIFDTRISKVYKEIDSENWKIVLGITLGFVLLAFLGSFFIEIRGVMVLALTCIVFFSIFCYFKGKKAKVKLLSV